MTQTIVIFGGSGFIGQALCQEAIKQSISVISISKHGRPKNNEFWMDHPLITWVSMDILETNQWQTLIEPSTPCINLIGILFENKRKGLTYERMIVQANQRISQEAEKKQCPYVFLSAKGGPRQYVAAKKQAEQDLMTHTHPVIIIRSGLVVTKESPLRYFQGLGIKAVSHLPVIKKLAQPVYPTSLDNLVQTILKEVTQPNQQHKIINDLR